MKIRIKPPMKIRKYFFIFGNTFLHPIYIQLIRLSYTPILRLNLFQKYIFEMLLDMSIASNNLMY